MLLKHHPPFGLLKHKCGGFPFPSITVSFPQAIASIKARWLSAGQREILLDRLADMFALAGHEDPVFTRQVMISSRRRSNSL